MQINRGPTLLYYFIHAVLVLSVFLSPTHASGRNRLRVGVSRSNPPFSSIGQGDAAPRGFSVDLAGLIAENMGTTAEICAMDEPLIEALNDKSVDMVIGMMDESYSTPEIYLLETTIKGLETKLFVNSGCPPINSYSDLEGYSIAIEKGNHIPLLLPSNINVRYMEVEGAGEALALVNSGDAQIYISKNLYSTQQTIKKNHFQDIKEVGTPIEVSPLIIAVNRMDPDLLTSVSMAYGKILENGSYYTVYNKWLAHGLRSYMDRYRKIILAVAWISIFALLLFILWNYTLKKKVVLITGDLRNSEKKYRDLIESSPDMIYLISRQGEIRLANRIALDYPGHDEDDITSITLYDLALPEQSRDVTDLIDEVFKNRYSNKKLTLRGKNGHDIEVDIKATIMSGSERMEELACCFSRDITERMRLEENLLHADRLAVMGRVAAGIAHEINNPLGVILSNTQDVLYNDLSDEDSAESMKLIECSALRTAKIIEDMLNFTSPVELHAVHVDLPRLIEDSLFFLKQKLKQKDIKVERSFPGNPAGFEGDENLIRQLLINIFLNSIQSIKNDGVIRIYINETRADDGGKIILEIEDNGTGIPEKDLHKIFTPFYTSRKEDGGFGLGLFNAKIIVEKHKGAISARSEEGKGTVMKIVFPSIV